MRSTRLITTASISLSDMVFPARPSARCAPTERRRTPVTTRRRSTLCDSANSWRPMPPPTMEPSIASLSSATSATVWMPWACNLSAVLAPTPQSLRTGSGCRKANSRSGGTSSRPSGLASWLATLARNLVRAMPTVMGSPTPVADRRPQLGRDLHGRARHPAQPTDVEEGLVDGHAVRQGEWCRGTPRTPPRWPPSTPTCAVARRWRADTAAWPGARPSRCARRRPWPRSWPQGRRRPRRSRGDGAAWGRRAARPMRRTSRGPRAGWTPSFEADRRLCDAGSLRSCPSADSPDYARSPEARTYVRIRLRRATGIRRRWWSPDVGRGCPGCGPRASTPSSPTIVAIIMRFVHQVQRRGEIVCRDGRRGDALGRARRR